jgi:hypothetical protein
MVRRRWKDPAPSAVQTQEPKTKVSPRLKATVGLMKIEAVEFNLPRGVPEVDECGLAEIDNSKEETRGTQFRQVLAARCVIPYVQYAA